MKKFLIIDKKVDNGMYKLYAGDNVTLMGKITTDIFGTRVEYRDIHRIKILNICDAKGRIVENASVEVSTTTQLQSI